MNRPTTSGPGGDPPPTAVVSPHGRELDLVAVANAACSAYDAEFPDERERYGPAGMQWCRHDNQYVLDWAVLSLTGALHFEEQLAWLARILEHRGFPLDRLARSLELLAMAVRASYPGEGEVADRIIDGAGFISSRPSFIA